MKSETLTADDVRLRLRRACEAAGGVENWAINSGVTPAYVWMVLSGSRKPGPKIEESLELIPNPKTWRLDNSNSHV